MIRVFFPGQDVPGWLEKVEIQGDPKQCSVRFGNIVAVVLYKNKYHAVCAFPFFSPLRVVCPQGTNMSIAGQKGGVIFYGNFVSALMHAIKKQ